MADAEHRGARRPRRAEFIAFWVDRGRVVAGMNVNVWKVNKAVQALIGSGRIVDAERCATRRSRWRALIDA